MDLNLTDLKYFFETAQTLNISRAAERLGIGQSALSQSLKRLEGQLNSKLLDRYKTGVRLTKAGEKLLITGKELFDQCHRLKEAISDADDAIAGSFSIGCHTSVAQYTLPHFLPSLLASYPDLNIRLKHGLSREITEDVISFRVDFGIVINAIRHPDLVIIPLSKDRVTFWSSSHPVRDTLIYDPNLLQTQTLLKQLKNQSELFPRKIESSSLEVIAALASAGTGIAILPEKVASLYNKLKLFNPTFPSYEDKLSLVYRSDRTFNKTAALITNKIKNIF